MTLNLLFEEFWNQKQPLYPTFSSSFLSKQYVMRIQNICSVYEKYFSFQGDSCWGRTKGESGFTRSLRRDCQILLSPSAPVFAGEQIKKDSIAKHNKYSVWSLLLIFKFYTDAELNISREEFHGHIPSPNRPDNQLASRKQGGNWSW